MSQDDIIYSDANIGGLLEQRHMAGKIRRGGGRLRGPAKRAAEQGVDFAKVLRELTELQQRH